MKLSTREGYNFDFATTGCHAANDATSSVSECSVHSNWGRIRTQGPICDLRSDSEHAHVEGADTARG